MQLPVRQRVKPAIDELYHRRSVRCNLSISRLERKRTVRIRTGKYSGRTAGRWIFPPVFLPNAQPVSLLHAFDVVDFEKGNCSLGLAMGVEHLALIRLPLGHVSIAAPISSVVRDQHELEHMIMQRLRHLIESADVQIQSWDRKHVRAITKIARQLRSEEHTSELQSLMRISYA